MWDEINHDRVHLMILTADIPLLLFCLLGVFQCIKLFTNLQNNCINSMKYIKINAWVTVNNDFFVTSETIRQWWKSLPNRLTSDKKIVIHGSECTILFLTRYFMSWTHKSAKNYHRALISPLLPRAAFSDRALWRHHNWSVTSWKREKTCIVIFVDCHCTRKLAQRRSSLVNNSREYRYLATRYSRLGV